jgi:hypothetical protein
LARLRPGGRLMGREKRSKFANDAKSTADLASSLAQLVTQTVNTSFNPDGSIVETHPNGMTKTTTFNPNGTITEVYSAPINKTKTISFNADGSISEVIS